MEIIEDSRQKEHAHELKHKAWDDDGTVLYRCKLPYGDYALPPRVSVDTKANLEEIANNLCGARSERERVEREEKLALKLHGKLIYLIETPDVKTKTDLIGKSILLKSGQIVSGEQLMRAIEKHEHVYGSAFEFCAPEESAKRIEEILGSEGG